MHELRTARPARRTDSGPVLEAPFPGLGDRVRGPAPGVPGTRRQRAGPASDGPGIPYDHLALRVRTPTGPWLADVGFGKHSHYPLRLDSRADQPDPGGVFRVVETPEGDLDILRD
ncbi:arylamine N-acetyltransferase, partial [Streptomyces sp. NPDC060322]|uniref:arylamine N-acetyltransferase n=1 Tax=Streptomyces sp. NPDC060322 TaxID=3347097 RepID=UPI0036684CC0